MKTKKLTLLWIFCIGTLIFTTATSTMFANQMENNILASSLYEDEDVLTTILDRVFSLLLSLLPIILIALFIFKAAKKSNASQQKRNLNQTTYIRKSMPQNNRQSESMKRSSMNPTSSEQEKKTAVHALNDIFTLVKNQYTEIIKATTSVATYQATTQNQKRVVKTTTPPKQKPVFQQPDPVIVASVDEPSPQDIVSSTAMAEASAEHIHDSSFISFDAYQEDMPIAAQPAEAAEPAMEALPAVAADGNFWY